MIDIVGKRRIWYSISALLIIPGVIALLVHGLSLGIDFTGGTSWELQFQKPVDSLEVRSILATHGYSDSIVQTSQDNTILIRMKELKEGSPEKTAIENEFRARFGEFKELQIETVGPTVGNAIRNRAILAVILASIGVLSYIAWAFRNTDSPVLYGTVAIVAMLHDVLFVLGVFSILGWVADIEVDALFVTAVLTVMGFSVHDTIVVFDRIRENLGKRIAPTFEETVNYSVAQTMVRSLNTSLTVILTLAALYLFGGESTRWFVFALLIGVAAGTYSSIFNASQLLVSWRNGEVQRFFLFWRKPSGSRARAT
ncbi:MAG TPA: protein translocase subunit SecF [Thermomicrobiales bacterium]|mgnify:FL=1|nr:protein translocase subunit SecF [Chloroflexota bacterium]HBY45038.1 protein translocase subunit SecF [Chloroflexota bacterium]HQZ89747.1 protein translocase subunit SecF [Thermomicrobiales bacterium]HRA31853.1 protein translocase subunit SecF [Thermomicrobiales bacterium]